jgi:hypothetical protein
MLAIRERIEERHDRVDLPIVEARLLTHRTVVGHLLGVDVAPGVD